MKLQIGDITPLVFRPAVDDPSATELRFTQRFGRYDHIVVQFTTSLNKFVSVNWYEGENYVGYVSPTRVNVGNNWLHSAIVPVLPEGFYTIRLNATMDGVYKTIAVSQEFEVTRAVENDADWALIEYGGASNNTAMDAMFVMNGARVPFLLRLPAGFKPMGWEGSVQTETYRTQRQELRVLYSAPYEKQTLTIGTAAGLPVEYVRLLNNILSCEYVYINGERWCRSEGAVPEKQLVMAGAQMFTASVVLERQRTLDNYPVEVYQTGDEFNNDYNNDFDI